MNLNTCWSVEVHHGTIRTRVTARAPDGVQSMRSIRSQAGQVEETAALIREMCGSDGQARLPHGTSVTISDASALAGPQDEPVLLLVTQGHLDVVPLERAAASNRPNQKPLRGAANGPRTVEISERHDATGACVRPLDTVALRETLRTLYREGYRAVAVSFLHSAANAAHESLASEIAADVGFKFIALGHTITQPKAGYGPRTQSAVSLAGRMAVTGHYVTDLSAALQQFVDISESASPRNHPDPEFVFDIVSYKDGVISIGADGTASRSKGPASFGMGGPLTVFDCAVLANDFAYLGLDDLDDPKADLGLDPIAADARLCDVLAQRAAELDVPFGSPADLARSILSQVQGTSDISVSPQIAPGAEEWFVARLEATMSKLDEHGGVCAGIAIPFGDTLQWLACQARQGLPCVDGCGGLDGAVTCGRIAITSRAQPVLYLYHDDTVAPQFRDAAVEGLSDIVDVLGVEAVRVIAERVLERREAQFLSQLGEFGYGRCEVSFDDGEAVVAYVKADKDGGRLLINFSGTSPRQGPLATTRRMTLAAVRHAIFAACTDRTLIPADILSKCDVVIPETSMLAGEDADPEHSDIVCQAVITAVMNVMAGRASGQGCVTHFSFSGVHEGAHFQNAGVLGGGEGATHNDDGRSAALGPLVTRAGLDVEALEQQYPVRVEEFILRPSSGGQGSSMGGDGVICSIRTLDRAVFSVVSSNIIVAPFGARGGQPGLRGEVSVMRDMAQVEWLESRDKAMLAQGDLVIIKTPGGGGFG